MVVAEAVLLRHRVSECCAAADLASSPASKSRRQESICTHVDASHTSIVKT